MAEGSTVNCSFFSCPKNIRKEPSLRRFYFPVKDNKRCTKWIVNSGNVELFKLDMKKLKNRFLCEDHFQKEDMLQKKLVKNAVPVEYSENMEILEPVKSYSASKSSSSSRIGGFDEQIPSTSKDLSPSSSNNSEEQVLRDIITNMPVVISPERNNLKRKIGDMSITIKKLKTNLKKQKLLTSNINNLNMVPSFPRALVTMQLCHKKRSPWLSNEKTVALSLFYKSPSTYKFMRSKKVNLPSPSTLSTWFKSFRFRPGINRGLMNCVKVPSKVGNH